MGRIKAAIFDMDGLLVDTEPLYFQAESELARRFGKEFTMEVMEKMMGHKAIRSIQIMIETLDIGGTAEEILALRDMLYRDLLVKGVKAMPGVFEFLDWLESDGYRKAVGTSSKTEKLGFEAPILQKYTDMQDLLLLDPIHEVDEAGWPHANLDLQNQDNQPARF